MIYYIFTKNIYIIYLYQKTKHIYMILYIYMQCFFRVRLAVEIYRFSGQSLKGDKITITEGCCLTTIPKQHVHPHHHGVPTPSATCWHRADWTCHGIRRWIRIRQRKGPEAPQTNSFMEKWCLFLQTVMWFWKVPRGAISYILSYDIF